MYRDFETDPVRFRRHPFPGWSLDAVRTLFEKRHVTAIGHEALDTDATDDMRSETWILKHGHWQIEVMAHLDAIPATGALLVVAWPKPARGLGFPARAFAILP
jgi:kynurenine formamidase